MTITTVNIQSLCVPFYAYSYRLFGVIEIMDVLHIKFGTLLVIAFLRSQNVSNVSYQCSLTWCHQQFVTLRPESESLHFKSK